MLLSRDKIQKQEVISISGDESWLKPVYGQFADQPSNRENKLTGEFQFTPRGEGVSIEVKGRFRYRPQVNCDRCLEPLSWPLDMSIDCIYQPSPTRISRNEVHNLSHEELGVYFFDEKGNMDLELLINDMVNLALPSAYLCSVQKGEDCTLPEIFGSGHQSSTSPFDILKALTDKR